MTNGSVTTVTSGNLQGASGTADGVTLNVVYKDGAQEIRVTPKTEVKQIVRSERGMLKSGTKITGGARLAAEGSAQAVLLNLVP